MNDEKKAIIIIALLVILVIALGINYVIYKRQEAAQQRRLQVRKIQGILPDLLGCLGVLKQTQCSVKITQLIESYASELLEEMAQLAASPQLLNSLQNSSNSNNSSNADVTLHSKQVQQAVNKTLTVMQRLHKQNKITLQQLMEFNIELKITTTLFDVDALLNLSQAAITNSKIAVAKSNLRSIKGMLVKIPDSDPRKEKLSNRANNMSKNMEPGIAANTGAEKIPAQEGATPTPEST